MRLVICSFATIVLLMTQPLVAGEQKRALVIDTDSVSLKSVGEAASKRFAKTVVIEPDSLSQVVVHGINLDNMSMSEFQAALSRNKLTAIENSNTLLIMKFLSAKQASVPVIRSINASYDEWQWVTLVMSTGKLHAPYLVPLLRPLVQQQGHFAASAEANSLIVTAPYGVVRRIHHVVDALNSNIDNQNK